MKHIENELKTYPFFSNAQLWNVKKPNSFMEIHLSFKDDKLW
jgi:hypothetical protein